MIMLQIVDTQWKDHLYSLDHLKEGIGLRGYGQRDPLVEYKKESYQMFQALMDRIDEEILRWSFLYQPSRRPRRRQRRRRPSPGPVLRSPHARASRAGAGRRQDRAAEPLVQRPFGQPVGLRPRRPAARGLGRTSEVQTIRREGKKVGRNDPCPCGSGKKYKKCHGGS